MSTLVSKDQLRQKLLDHLEGDKRAINGMAACSDAIYIEERLDLTGGPNWALARWDKFQALSPDLQAAMLSAEAEVQAEYRLRLPPPGLLTINQFV